MHTERTLDGVAYHIEGTGAQTIVLLHPAFADRRAFGGQILALRDRYRLVAPDLPGHGNTKVLGKSVDPQPTMATAAEAISDIFFAENIGSAHVVGVSMGALVAEDFARRFPKLVRSLTVVGAYAVDDAVAIKAQRREMVRILPMALFRLGRFKRYVAEAAAATDQGRQTMARMLAGFKRSDLFGMKGLDAVMDPDRSDALRCPLLIVVGREDRTILHDAAHRWVAKVPGAEIQIFEGAGHCVNLDVPEAFNAALEAFVARVDGEQR